MAVSKKKQLRSSRWYDGDTPFDGPSGDPRHAIATAAHSAGIKPGRVR